jgi:hypothetical protein
MSKKKRRSPRKHEVHPRHPRYSTDRYERGTENIGRATSSQYVVKDPAEIIAEQIAALEPYFQSRYSVKSLVKVDENTLRLCSKPRGSNQVNMDIKYNPGTDLYDIKAYEITRDMSVYEVYDVDMIYAENLTDVMNRVLFKRDFKRGKLVQEGMKL